MGFVSFVIVNIVGGIILATGATWLAPLLGFTKLGIAGGSLAASAQSWCGKIAAGSLISALMSRTMK